MFSLFTSLIFSRKKVLFSTLTLSICANSIFFFANYEKWKLIKTYVSYSPDLSINDVVVLKKDRTDLSNPQSFVIEEIDNIRAHIDVKNVSALSLTDELIASNNPDLYVISLKDDANVNSWVATINKHRNYTAMHSSQYRKLYRKAILGRNKAVYEHYLLLKYMGLGAMIALGLIAFAYSVCYQGDLRVFFSEGVGYFSALFRFCFLSSFILAFIYAATFGCIGHYLNMYEFCLSLFIETIKIALAIFAVSTVFMLSYQWRVSGKNPV